MALCDSMFVYQTCLINNKQELEKEHFNNLVKQLEGDKRRKGIKKGNACFVRS